MKTALQQLIDKVSDELDRNKYLGHEFPQVANILLYAEDLLKVEREQHQDTWEAAGVDITFGDYYEKTYDSNLIA
jgi:hypothetical protein